MEKFRRKQITGWILILILFILILRITGTMFFLLIGVSLMYAIILFLIYCGINILCVKGSIFNAPLFIQGRIEKSQLEKNYHSSVKFLLKFFIRPLFMVCILFILFSLIFIGIILVALAFKPNAESIKDILPLIVSGTGIFLIVLFSLRILLQSDYGYGDGTWESVKELVRGTYLFMLTLFFTSFLIVSAFYKKNPLDLVMFYFSKSHPFQMNFLTSFLEFSKYLSIWIGVEYFFYLLSIWGISPHLFRLKKK